MSRFFGVAVVERMQGVNESAGREVPRQHVSRDRLRTLADRSYSDALGKPPDRHRSAPRAALHPDARLRAPAR